MEIAELLSSAKWFLLFAPHRDILYRERLFHRNAAFENKEQLIFIHHLDGVDKLPHDVVTVFRYFKGGVFQRLAEVVDLPGEFIRTVLLRLVLLQCFLQGFDFLRNFSELVLVAFGVKGSLDIVFCTRHNQKFPFSSATFGNSSLTSWY
jgi:hypothetical protein